MTRPYTTHCGYLQVGTTQNTKLKKAGPHPRVFGRPASLQRREGIDTRPTYPLRPGCWGWTLQPSVTFSVQRSVWIRVGKSPALLWRRPRPTCGAVRWQPRCFVPHTPGSWAASRWASHEHCARLRRLAVPKPCASLTPLRCSCTCRPWRVRRTQAYHSRLAHTVTHFGPPRCSAVLFGRHTPPVFKAPLQLATRGVWRGRRGTHLPPLASCRVLPSTARG